MNKFLATLLAGTFTLTLGASAFAADAAKPVEAVGATTANAAEPAYTESAAVTPAADTKAATTKAMQKHHPKHHPKHHRHHAKKVVKTTATSDAKKALTGK